MSPLNFFLVNKFHSLSLSLSLSIYYFTLSENFFDPWTLVWKQSRPLMWSAGKPISCENEEPAYDR